MRLLFRYTCIEAQSVKTGLISDLILQLLYMFTLVIMHDTQESGRINLSCLPEPENKVCACSP